MAIARSIRNVDISAVTGIAVDANRHSTGQLASLRFLGQRSAGWNRDRIGFSCIELLEVCDQLIELLTAQRGPGMGLHGVA